MRRETSPEAERLQSLLSYKIMGTEPEAAFDDIACLAAKICGTPAAFVAFVDDIRQFCKASVGAGEVRDATMRLGFCRFTVAKQDILVIPDALADPLYADNPAVASAPFVRFYAGSPLRSPEGHVLGTVCVVDHQPRELSEDQLDALQILGRQVEALLALRRSVNEQADTIAERDRSYENLRASEATVKEREERIKSLYALTSRTDISFAEKVEGLLNAGREWLDMDTGVLGHTDCDAGTYTVVQINASGPTVPAGYICPLEETFCSNAVRRSPELLTLTVENVGADAEWREHKSYKMYGREAYHAAVVLVNGKTWGVVAFHSGTPRPYLFTPFDTDIIRLMAQWVGGELSRQETENALLKNTAQQRRFVREMLASVTEGKLLLCDSPQDLADPLAPASDPIALTSASLRLLRQRVTAVAEELQLALDRRQDLITAVGEASMNAVKHGGGGTAQVFADAERSIVQVRIQDHGKGIRDEDLHRATLEKGWSGAGSFGHGFYLMLRTVDRTYLLTGWEGTTIVLEQETMPPPPSWFVVASA